MNAPTQQEGDEKFKALTRALWKEFAVSGIGADLSSSDPDGEGALGLLRQAGIKPETEYVNSGDEIPGKIHIDTGNREGVVVGRNRGQTELDRPHDFSDPTAYIDHHAYDSKRGTSATQYMYDTLTGLGLLPKTEYYDKFVDFITHEDNRSYPNEKELFQHADRTVWGLVKHMKFEDLLAYFKDGREPNETLSDQDLKKYHLERASKEIHKAIPASLDRIKELRQQGFALNTKRYGRILIDPNRSVPLAFIAAKGAGFDGYVIWNERTNNFFVSTPKPFKGEFSQGRPVRETMWIMKGSGDPSKPQVTLRDIVTQLAGKDYSAHGKLKEMIEKAERPAKPRARAKAA